jgi:hypothetical protein
MMIDSFPKLQCILALCIVRHNGTASVLKSPALHLCLVPLFRTNLLKKLNADAAMLCRWSQ